MLLFVLIKREEYWLSILSVDIEINILILEINIQVTPLPLFYIEILNAEYWALEKILEKIILYLLLFDCGFCQKNVLFSHFALC